MQQTYQACIHVHVVCEAHCADGRECTVQGAFIIDNHAVFLVLFGILLMLCYKILHFSKHLKQKQKNFPLFQTAAACAHVPCNYQV